MLSIEKGNIIAKLNIKDYSKLLEEILANKPFSENAKNILLEILYKIEAGYNDYKTVKVNVLPKKDIIEEINKKLSEIVPRQQQIRNELEEIIRELESDYYE